MTAPYEPPARLDHAAVRRILAGLMLAMFLSALDQTIVATALATIGRAYANVENLAWIVTAYLLAATAVTPLYGKLSDIHGRRPVLLGGIAIFVAGLGRLRACADHAGADRRALPPGPWRRRPDRDVANDRRRCDQSARARPLPGLFRRGIRDVLDRRAGARRRIGRAPALELHLLDQPAARPARVPDHRARPEGAAAPRASATSSISSVPP